MDLNEVRQSLLAELEELRSLSADTRESRNPVMLDQQSVGRLSRMDAMQVQAMAKRNEQRRQQQIRRIEATLKRIEEDEYGFCVTCGDEIAEDRLKLDLTATLCSNCMNN